MAVEIEKFKFAELTPLDFYMWICVEERSLQEKCGYMRRVARSYFVCCYPA